MTCRVKIDAPAGIIELEGDASFVGSFFEKLVPLIEKARFGHAADAAGAVQSEVQEADARDSEERPKRKKRTTRQPPAGASCRDRINALKTDDFFKEKRTPSDIVEGLGKKGWTHIRVPGAQPPASFANGLDTET
jgi:hypothetical protein